MDSKLKEELKSIEEHFKNLSDKQFQDNLKKCGINEIEPSSVVGISWLIQKIKFR